jgi:hypothetical protein
MPLHDAVPFAGGAAHVSVAGFGATQLPPPSHFFAYVTTAALQLWLWQMVEVPGYEHDEGLPVQEPAHVVFAVLQAA